MATYKIYIDGACKANGDGGIGVVWLRNDKKVMEFSKKFSKVTNNIMELMAIKTALLSIKSKIKSLTIYSDSQYAIGIISNPKWIPKKNIELVKSIRSLLNEKQKLVIDSINFKHVKGHSGNTYNEICDKLAVKASNNL